MTKEERETANFRKLPVTCYSLPVPGMGNARLIRLVRGEFGYYPADNQIKKGETPEAARDRLNGGSETAGGATTHNATPAQVAAMLAGSMFGFHTPGADADHYQEDGTPQRGEMPNELLPADSLPPGLMTGLTEADIHAHDAAAEGDDAQRLLDEAADDERERKSKTPPKRTHLFGRVYGYPYYKPCSSDLDGWFFFFDSGDDDERTREAQERAALKVPVSLDDEQVGDFARGMDLAFSEGKKEGHRHGYSKAQREVSDVATLILSPIVNAIEAANKER